MAVENNAITPETAWDIANVGIGAYSLSSNLAEGNYLTATVDGIGLIYDGIAAATPILPAGASTAIRASRTSSTVQKSITAANFFLRGQNTLPKSRVK
ncbi:hypothetical protein [Moraxella marmotae]|uniref:hypothetical protein n=1 Tax=Moraxella marmotae TaxID=3344520 RepID=UPI0035F40E06